MKDVVACKVKKGDDLFDVTITQLKPSESLKVLLWLGRLVGGSAGKVLGGLEGGSLTDLVDKKSEESFNMEKLGDALTSALDRIDDEETIKYFNLLLSCAETGGNSLHVDHPIFQNNLIGLLKIVRKSLEVNFSDFLQEAKSAIKGLIGKIAKIKNSKVSQKDQV